MKFLFVIIGVITATVALADEDSDSTEKYFPQKLTAQGLLYYCASSALSNTGRNRQNYCSGFVSGVEESARLLDIDLGGKNVLCVPAGKSARHFRDIYIKHVSKQTTDLERPAAIVVLEALESAYPCRK